MADIVRLKDHLEHKPVRRPLEATQARILLFTGVRYARSEPLLIGAPSLTGKRPTQDIHPYEG
ncbi:hypothetical protein H4S14_002983 [Agrobacterium vitis]|nr:hypothetical protein [Agrobacterium vitis]MBE1439221.1 hypothetical protein [Agrobacterium vitis]